MQQAMSGGAVFDYGSLKSTGTRAIQKLLRFLAGCAVLWLQSTAHAAIATHSYHNVGGNTWTVDLMIVNDGVPTEISGVTFYFDENLFSNLALQDSPPTWDSLVVAPDLVLPAPGFLDTFLLDRSQSLTLGQSQDGFAVQFDFLGNGAPGALPYDIVDENFSAVFSGRTIAAGPTPLPEPGVAWLLGMGLAALSLRRRQMSCSADAMAGAVA